MPWTQEIGDDRETKDLHADWWSPAQDANGRYIERCVIYADYLGIDEQSIRRRSFGVMKTPKRAGEPVDTTEMAKADTYKLQHFIVELTDAKGRIAPLVKINADRPVLTEKFLTGLPERDRAFILEAIDSLKEPVVPVTEEHEAQAAQQEARAAAARAAGVPDDHIRTPKGAEELALDSFPAAS